MTDGKHNSPPSSLVSEVPRMFWRFLVPVALLAVAAAQADEASKPRLDPHGDPLPPGAVMRLGSARLRPDMPALAAAFAPDGKTLFSIGNEAMGRGCIHAWDTATGKLLRRVHLPADAGRCFAVTADGKSLVVGCLQGAVRWLDPVTGAEQRGLTIGGGNNVTGMSLSADGKTLLARLATGMISVCDAAAARERYSTPGAGGGLPLAALLPDGKQFVLARQDHTLHLVDAATGEDVRAFDMGGAAAGRAGLPRRVQRLAISPDGKLLAFGGLERRVTVCSVETGKVVGHFDNPTGGTKALAFAPGGRFLALGGTPGVRVFATASGKELRRLDFASGGTCLSLAYAPDGKTLAAISQDGNLHLWDVFSAEETPPPAGHSGNVQALVFLADGKHLVSYGGDGRLIAWETATGREVDRYSGVPFALDTMTRSADGKGVAGLGNGDGNLHVWRPGSGLEVQRLGLPRAPGMRSAFSPDGRKAALFSNLDRKLRLFDLEGKDREGRVLTTAANVWCHLLAFAPDGRRLATLTSDGKLRVWDCATGREVRELEAGDEGPRLAFTSQLLFAADGRSLLLADNNNGLQLREVAGGRVRVQMPGGSQRLQSLAWSPGGRLVARGNLDGSVQVFAAPAGKEVARLEGRQGMVPSLAFSPDGRLLASGGGNGNILIWEMPETRLPQTVLAEAKRNALWTDLIDVDAGRAYRAVIALAEAPDPALALIKERLKPRPAPPDPRRLEKLIAQLDSDSFVEREKASQELAAAGPAAEEVLRKALDGEASTEVRKRVRELLERIAKKVAVPERLRALRAIEVLERIGTPAAKQLLADLARQVNDPVLERDIQDTLARLGERR
jgi:WD40 repeat protein